jgi:hypothetical protein
VTLDRICFVQVNRLRSAFTMVWADRGMNLMIPRGSFRGP